MNTTPDRPGRISLEGAVLAVLADVRDRSLDRINNPEQRRVFEVPPPPFDVARVADLVRQLIRGYVVFQPEYEGKNYHLAIVAVVAELTVSAGLTWPAGITVNLPITDPDTSDR
jgi:hypothetical protein